MSNYRNSATPEQAPVSLSTGGGIAVATIWVVTTALTVFFALLLFTNILVDNTAATESIKGADGDKVLFVFLIMAGITALPYGCAIAATKLILGRN